MGKRWDAAKIGRRAPLEADVEADMADPAHGAKVARCKACGMPNPSDIVGIWNGLRVRFPACQRCVMAENPPDPLQAA